jgi:hypothetical protein
LIEKKKIITADGFLSNPKAETVLVSTQIAKQKKTAQARAAAYASHGKTEPIQGNAHAVAMRALAGPVPKRRPTRPRLQPSSDYTDDFLAMWNVYPRVRGGSKKDAFKRWLKLSDEDRATVTRIMPTWVKMMRNRDQEHIRHFEVFLNKRIFETLENATTVAAKTPDVIDPAQFTEERWKTILAVYEVTNNWHQAWGPAPRRPGCLVPLHLVSIDAQQSSSSVHR